MKRILALILSLITVFSLFSCGESIDLTETLEDALTTVEETPKKLKLEGTNVKEQLAAIPIAKDSMSEMELRQICVDYFNLMTSFPWIPNNNFSHKKLNILRVKGGVYGGLPYLSTSSGNLYRAMEYYDEETGVLDVSYFAKNPEYFGNACSGGAFWSWFRVVNSFNSSKGAWTYNCTHLNGCLRVGPYTYKDVQNFHEVKSTSENKYTAENAVKENTEQIMYQSYAETKIADGVIHPGHVRMVTVAPTVVKNPDGTINGDESWLGCTEQIKYVNSQDNRITQPSGISYNRQGFVEKKYTFKELYEKYYIPFTFAEFLGTDPVEDGEVTMEGIEGESASLETLKASVLRTNYALSDVFLTVTDSNGKEVLNLARRKRAHYSYTMKGEDCYDEEAVNALMPYAEKGGHTITISAQIANGEKLVAYSGLLTK